jgi:outer membrane protein
MRRIQRSSSTLIILAMAWTSAAAAQEVPSPPESSIDLEAVLRGTGDGLTADEAARRAVDSAPSMTRARATRRVASATVERAVYGFVPRLDLSFRYTRLSEIQNATLMQGPDIDPDVLNALVDQVEDPVARELHRGQVQFLLGFSDFRFPVLLNNYSFNAQLAYPVSDVFLQVLPAWEGAQENERAAERSIDAQSEEVAFSAREAFYNYARARGALAVAQIANEQALARHRQVQAFVAAGTAARVDELRIRAQVAATQVAVARASGGVEVAQIALRTLMHAADTEELAIGEDLLAPLAPLPAPPAELVQRALDERDDVEALEHLLEAGRHQIDAAEGSRWPHLAISANLTVANPNQRVFPQTEEFRESWDVSAILSWSPSDVLSGEALANEARARRDEVQANLTQLTDAIRIQVYEAATAYASAREALDAARLGVEAAEESHRVQMERYRAGASTVTDVLDASAEQVRAQLDLVNTAIDARVAWARLSRAIGTGSPE